MGKMPSKAVLLPLSPAVTLSAASRRACALAFSDLECRSMALCMASSLDMSAMDGGAAAGEANGGRGVCFQRTDHSAIAGLWAAYPEVRGGQQPNFSPRT